MVIVHTIRSDMAKTPTIERETATFRLPATLLERARREGAARGLAYVRSVEEALEIYFLSRLPPPMAKALEQDIKDLKVSRENYFYSLLDARYREVLSKAAGASRGQPGNESGEHATSQPVHPARRGVHCRPTGAPTPRRRPLGCDRRRSFRR